MRERTTDLDKLKAGHQITWGEVIQIHTIGEYDIVEYHPFKSDGVRLTRQPDYDQQSFSGYLNGKSVSESWNSLDAALAGLIARKHGDGHAGYYFMKMIAKEE